LWEDLSSGEERLGIEMDVDMDPTYRSVMKND